ncbi:3357_t:CDS:2, partial [Dentiscutata erythropus]
ILEELNQIRPILKDELVEINIVDKLTNEIQQIFEKLSKSSSIENVGTKLIDHLERLKLLAHEEAYLKRKEFISFLTNSSNKIKILFKNGINTEEEINRRARVLGSCFHPDRTKNPKCPYVLHEIFKSQGDELFKLISEFKEHLLNKLKKTLEIEDHEKYGNELWRITIDYNNASKGQWDKLKVLKKDDIKELSSELLKQNSMHMGELAFYQYRAACKIADKAKLLKKQVKLRGYMALCLYFTNKFLEAPLYTLAALLLQMKSNNVTQQEINEAKKIFVKVNGGREERERNEDGMSSDSSESDFNNSMALIRVNDQGITFNDREIIQITLAYTVAKLFVKAERSLVRFQTSYKEILRAKRCTFSYKKGQEIFKKITIRENLNKIMKQALSAYDDEKYQEFINVLSEEYDDENHKRLLNWCDKFGITRIVDMVSGRMEAKKLDKLTSELRSQGIYEFFKGACSKLKDSILEEIRNIARINIAILTITEFSMDAYQEAIETVEEVRKSVLSDIDTPLFITFPVETKSATAVDINYLNNQQSFNQDKYYQAIYFERLAEKEAKINKLKSLSHWQSAQENYNIAREINPDNLIYSFGYARCLLKLSKYTQVIKLSDTCPALNSSSKYLNLCSVAYFKQKKHADAMICNSEALNLDPGNHSAGKHRELVKKLNINNIGEHHINRYKNKLIYETDYLKNSHSNESPVYNILSIDGGGIRAGTSTGGIIAAGLSAPKFESIYINDEIEYRYLNSTQYFQLRNY